MDDGHPDRDAFIGVKLHKVALNSLTRQRRVSLWLNCSDRHCCPHRSVSSSSPLSPSIPPHHHYQQHQKHQHASASPPYQSPPDCQECPNESSQQAFRINQVDNFSTLHAPGMEHGSLSGLAGNVAADWSLAPAHTLPNEEASLWVRELENKS